MGPGNGSAIWEQQSLLKRDAATICDLRVLTKDFCEMGRTFDDTAQKACVCWLVLTYQVTWIYITASTQTLQYGILQWHRSISGGGRAPW